MRDIVIPKLNANDESYVLVEWACADGATVRAGDVLAVIETSKATVDLEAEAAGVLQRAATPGTECRIGDVVGRLFGSAEEVVATPVPSASPATTPAVVLTRPARELAEAHGIALHRLEALGPGVIRTADVQRLIESADTSVRPLSKVQRAVAATVSASHAQIPSAYTVVRVRADAVLAARRTQSSALGLPELVVRAVAGAFDEFPAFFGTLRGNEIVLPHEAHVGVTVDVGTGLFVPVVRSAATRTAAEIGALIAGFHRTALGTGFAEADLRDGNVTVALHNYADVVLAVPIVFPGQVAAVSLGGLYQQVFTLGLAYDHRVVNGRDAVLFLKRLKADLERPARLAQLTDNRGGR